MANSYKDSINQAKLDIQTIIEKVVDLENQISTSLGNISKSIKQTQNAGNPKEVTTNINKQTKAVEKLTDEQKNQEKLVKKLATSQQNLTNARTKEHAQTVRNKKALTDYNRSLRKGAGEQAALTVRVKSFFKTLVAFDLARRLVDAFWQSLKSGFETLKVLDSIRLQFKYIIEGANEIERTFADLSRISLAFGANLLVITNRYVKFRAASKQANLGARETKRIFESVTKAAGVLGLKTDELKGIYLALEQMLSKGKVTTEELRRQLGERLPGAMGIMADAVGVTTSELDVMLKKGEIISAEVLPKFAIALEKAYGIENVDRIETIQAAQTRLTNAFIEFTKWVENALGLNKSLAKSLDWLAKNLQNIFRFLIILVNTLIIYVVTTKTAVAVTNLFTRTTSLARIATVKWGRALKALTNLLGLQGLAKSAGLAAASLLGLAGIFVALSAATLIYEVAIGRTRREQDLLNESKLKGAEAGEELARAVEVEIAKELQLIKIKRNSALVNAGIIDSEKIRKSAIKDNIKVIERHAESIRETVVALATQQAQYAAGSPKFAEYSENISKQTELYNDLILKIRVFKNELAGEQESIKGTVGWYDKLISDAEKRIKGLDNRKAISNVQDEIKSWKKLRDALLGVKKGTKDILDLPTDDMFGDVEGAGKIFDEFARNLTSSDLEKVLKSYEDTVEGISDKLLSFDLSDSDRAALEQQKENFQRRLEVVREYIAQLKKEFDDIEEIIEDEFVPDDIPKVGWLAKLLFGEDGDSVKLREDLESVLMAFQDFVALSSDISAGFSERKIQALEEEEDKIQEKYDLQKELIEEEVGDEKHKEERLKQLEKQKEIRDKELQKKIAAEKTRQAKIDKAAAIINAIIYTALSVLKASPAIPLMALAAAVGAIGIAAIVAQPIPKFKQGGKHKGGLAILGDGGKAEAGILPDGTVFKSESKDTLYDLPSGTTIHPDYNEFMSDNEKMKDMVYRASLVANISANPKKQFDKEFETRLRKGVVNSLRGLKIYNNNTGVGREVREALSDFKYENGFL